LEQEINDFGHELCVVVEEHLTKLARQQMIEKRAAADLAKCWQCFGQSSMV